MRETGIHNTAASIATSGLKELSAVFTTRGRPAL